MTKNESHECDMTDEIVEVRRAMAEIRISKGMNEKEKRSAHKVYEAMIKTAKSVQSLNATANHTIETCDVILRSC